jgi:hypothetical protein
MDELAVSARRDLERLQAAIDALHNAFAQRRNPR